MKDIKLNQPFIILPLIILLSACSAIYEDGNEMATECNKYINLITADELKVKVDNYAEMLLIDCRQPAEYMSGNITGSFNLVRGDLEFKILDDVFWEEEFMYTPLKTDTIIIYCKTGGRSALAASSLMQMGFKNVYSLKGGWLAFNGGKEPAPQAVSSGGCGE
jgi:rhodanese-related sulfurtransferase